MAEPKISLKVVCDGVRIDKNIVPAYMRAAVAGATQWSIDHAYYSGTGKRCESGSCNHKIHNVYVIKDETTGNTYEIGSECAKKYAGLTRLIEYWKVQLERAKGKALRDAKKKLWQEKRQQQAVNSQAEYAEDLAFIKKYFEYKQSPFLESIQRCFMNGWELSEKQAEIFEDIKNTTDFDDLEKQCDEAVLRFDDTLQVIERLDRVNFGMYPSSAFSNIRAMFAERGIISEKQLGLLKKLEHRFRRQIQR